MPVKGISRKHLAGLHVAAEFFILVTDIRIVRELVAVPRSPEPDEPAPGFFQFRRDHVAKLRGVHSEGDERWRHVDIIKAAGHAVLSSDGGKAESKLRFVRAQKSRERLAPPVRILRHPAEILLEGKSDLPEITSGSDDPRHGFGDRVSRAVIRTPRGQIRIKAIAHHGDGLGLSVRYRHLGHHGLGLRSLIAASVRHQHAGRADGTVEHLHKSSLGTDIQVRECFQPLCAHIRDIRAGKQRTVAAGRDLHAHGSLLMSPVGIQERSFDVYDLFIPPYEHQAGFLRHHSDRDCLQILFSCILQKSVHIGRIHHHGHPLLGFGDGDLGSVKACVFLWHFVEIHPQAVGEFSDGDRDAACAEVVALFDQEAHFLPTEHALKFPLGRSVSFLYLCPAHFNGGFGMYFGGARSSADAVASRASAEQDDHIARVGGLPDHGASGGRAENGADLHPFGHIIGMIDLLYIACRKADLVAVGAVASGRLAYQFFLRQFALESFLHAHRRVGGSCHAHRLIDIGPAGKRIPDRAAQTGGCAAEGFDLCRMVVCLVLEVDEPLLFFSIHIHRHHDGAGVDLLGFLLIIQASFRLQFFHGHQGQIHQADIFVAAVLHKGLAVPQILLIRIFYRPAIIALVKAHVCKLCRERGMPAVVRPVGIEDPDLRHGRVPMLFIPEILLDMQKVVEGHGQVQASIERAKRLFLHGAETFQHRNVGWFFKHCQERLRLGLSGLTGIHRIDAVGADRIHLCLRHVSADHIGGSGADDGIGFFIQKLDALHGGIRALVKLARQIFHGKNVGIFGQVYGFRIQDIHRGLGKDGPAGFCKQFIRNVLNIVTDQYARLCDRADPQITFDLMQQFSGLYRVSRFFLHIYSSYITHAILQTEPVLIR